MIQQNLENIDEYDNSKPLNQFKRVTINDQDMSPLVSESSTHSDSTQKRYSEDKQEESSVVQLPEIKLPQL